MIGSTWSTGENCSTSMPCAVGSGSSAISSSVSTTISPLGSSYPLATSAYGTSSPSIEQIRRNRIRPPSSRCTCRNVTSLCSVAAYRRMGIMTRPNEISPLHIARMVSQYPGSARVTQQALGRVRRQPPGGGRQRPDNQLRRHLRARDGGLRVVERTGERVRLGIVHAERGQPEGLLGVGKDPGERGVPGVGVVGPRVGGDDNQRDSRAFLGAVGIAVCARIHLVVEPAEIIEGDEDGGRRPVRAVLHGLDELAHPVVARGHGEPVVAGVVLHRKTVEVVATGGDQAEGRQPSRRCVGGEL